MMLAARARSFRFAALALLVSACSTTAPRSAPTDSAPIHPPDDLSRLPDPTPRAEPPSKYGNKSPYEVLGKTYYVLPNPDNYKETGRASWYGTKFHGRKTSSGEMYDMYQLTAAHRSLPIPSYVRITNLENQRSVIVRVNDRGPFHSERLIDVSYAAAVKLGFADRGTARVMVELVDGTDQTIAKTEPVDPPATLTPPVSSAALVAVPPEPAVPQPGQIFLQAGAFKDASGAERLRKDLTALVGVDVHVQRLPNDRYYRVRIGPVGKMSEATRLQALIVNASHPKPLIVRE